MLRLPNRSEKQGGTAYALPWARRAANCMLALVAVLFWGMPASMADDYRLGPMDKLHIRVADWQSADATAREWPSITGDYTVGPSGEISIPFVGQLQANGKTTSEIAKTIGDQLEQELGLLSRPDASVELLEYRPVYISGDVEAPGQYPYQPGLTVLKAISLAGGMRRSGNDGMRVERDYINAEGNFSVLSAERDSLLARRARLYAESEGKTEIDMPEELAGKAGAERLIAKETGLMKSRRESLDRQLSTLDDLKQLLLNQIGSLEKKIDSQNTQLALSREQMKGVGGLADKGLVVNQRVLSVQSSIAELEGKILDMETAELRARQDINRAERDTVTLKDDRETEISRALQETEAELEQLGLKMGMYRSLMGEALSHGPDAAQGTAKATAEIDYRLVHTEEGKITETVADENAAVMPGDVLKVEIVAPITQ